MYHDNEKFGYCNFGHMMQENGSGNLFYGTFTL